MYMPFALIGLIGIWHTIEYVHVIQQIVARSAETPVHCKLNVDQIVQSQMH